MKALIDVPTMLGRSEDWHPRSSIPWRIGWPTRSTRQGSRRAGPTFWDAKSFPGQRSVRKHPIYALEMALIADGVPMDKLYPLDVDRAFKKLEQLKTARARLVEPRARSPRRC